MRAAIPLRDVVGIAEHVFLVAIVPLQCRLDTDAVPVVLEVKYGSVDRRLVAIEMLDKCANSTFVLEHVALVVTLVGQLDSYTGIQE